VTGIRRVPPAPPCAGRRHDIDNTPATPITPEPLALGVDIVAQRH
jgi:hypothetical protein